MTPENQSEQAELEALNARLMQENQRLSRELAGLQAATCSRFPIEDPTNPDHFFVVRSTLDGAHALQRLLRQRFEDGRALGRAESADLIEGLQATLAMAG